ncbi:hypothetical protein BKA81DRAFT_146845 [Phyllosticta paracitricarpa]
MSPLCCHICGWPLDLGRDHISIWDVSTTVDSFIPPSHPINPSIVQSINFSTHIQHCRLLLLLQLFLPPTFATNNQQPKTNATGIIPTSHLHTTQLLERIPSGLIISTISIDPIRLNHNLLAIAVFLFYVVTTYKSHLRHCPSTASLQQADTQPISLHTPHTYASEREQSSRPSIRPV